MTTAIQVRVALLMERQTKAEESAEEAGGRIPGTRYERIDIPCGRVSYLGLAPDGGLRLTQEPETESFILEPVQRGFRAELILITPRGHEARINGQIAPRIARLMERDLLLLDDSRHVLHVSDRTRGTLGTPPPEFVGKMCPVCRVPFASDARVHICRCGQPLHAEGPEKKEEDRLECYRLASECPNCQQPLPRETRSAGSDPATDLEPDEDE
jgi:hypothetical protein